MTAPLPPDVVAYCQELLPDAEFRAQFTPAKLQVFRPAVGADGLSPLLLAHCWEGPGQYQLVVNVLLVEDWNTWETRRRLFARIGQELAERELKVVLLTLASEAWARDFTPEEERHRGTRLIADYPDKWEIIGVYGSTLDGRAVMARCRVHRGVGGNVVGCGEWELGWYFPQAWKEGELKIELNLLNTAWRTFLHTTAARRIRPQHN